MRSLFDKLEQLTDHLVALDDTFKDANNYSLAKDYSIFQKNYERFEELAKDTGLKYSNLKISSSGSGERIDLSFADEIYHQNDRQMKIADMIEYLFFSRGIYYLFQSNSYGVDRIPRFIELILRFVNLLMIFEIVTVDKKLRDALLQNLENISSSDLGFNDLKNWDSSVGLPVNNPNYVEGSPNVYFDSLLPKTAGGLWHEMLVYAFILRFNIGYIFPLLLAQKTISLEDKLSPPDLIILHKKTYRFYGIEIGSLKERQSGGFMAPSGMPVIPLDTLNSRVSDRCPSCNKWIGICDKVIEEFSDITSGLEPSGKDIRCMVDCEKYTLEEKLSGNCPYMKFKYKGTINNQSFSFADNMHHHYICCVESNSSVRNAIEGLDEYSDLVRLNELIGQEEKSEEDTQWLDLNYKNLKKKFNFIKTHSIFYSELNTLIKMNS